MKIYHGIIELPHRSETDGISERAAGRIKRRNFLCAATIGLDEKWWADSMKCDCYLRNIQDLLSDWKTLNERRFGEPFEGPVIPFGSVGEYHPISAKDLSRLHQYGKKVLFAGESGKVFFFLGCRH